jgi:putative transposase
MSTGHRRGAQVDVSQLAAIVKNRFKSIQYRLALIESFLAQTGLTLEPEPP